MWCLTCASSISKVPSCQKASCLICCQLVGNRSEGVQGDLVGLRVGPTSEASATGQSHLRLFSSSLRRAYTLSQSVSFLSFLAAPDIPILFVSPLNSMVLQDLGRRINAAVSDLTRSSNLDEKVHSTLSYFWHG